MLAELDRTMVILDTARLIACVLALAAVLTAIAWTLGLALAYVVTP